MFFFQKTIKMIDFKRFTTLSIIAASLVAVAYSPVSEAKKKPKAQIQQTATKKASKKAVNTATSKRTKVSRAAKGAAVASAALAGGAYAKSVSYAKVPAESGRDVDRPMTPEQLKLQSNAVLVADADSKELLYAKNPNAVLPIASITKLMTVIVNLEANVDLDEKVTISEEDFDPIKGTGSRLAPGSVFSRRELMHLALMSSENRAAHALGRSYPGGMQAAVRAMNDRARRLGMYSSNFVETTGLSPSNQSSPNDLALMVMHANKFPLIREFSTSPELQVESRRGRELTFRNTNALIKKDSWDIQVQKTGYISEAGRCLVMQARVGTRNLVIVLLDSVSKHSRFSDAERIRKYVVSRS